MKQSFTERVRLLAASLVLGLLACAIAQAADCAGSVVWDPNQSQATQGNTTLTVGDCLSVIQNTKIRTRCSTCTSPADQWGGCMDVASPGRISVAHDELAVGTNNVQVQPCPPDCCQGP